MSFFSFTVTRHNLLKKHNQKFPYLNLSQLLAHKIWMRYLYCIDGNTEIGLMIDSTANTDLFIKVIKSWFVIKQTL